MTDAELFQLLEKSLRYAGIVYSQSLYSTHSNAFDNNFILEYKHQDIPTDSLLFFVPSVSSNGTGCKLTIRIPYTVQGETSIRYRDDVYDIIVEKNDGTTRAAKENDIIAFRLCIFRFRKGTKKIILCNSPLYDDASYTSLTVTDCKFLNVPEVHNPESVQEKITLVTSKQFSELQERVAKLEQKFIMGVEDAEEVLADKPAGTVYIKYEDD